MRNYEEVMARFAERNSSESKSKSKSKKEGESLYSSNAIGFLAALPAKVFGSESGGKIGFLAAV